MAFIDTIQRLWVRLLGNHLVIGLVPALVVAVVMVYSARSALEQVVLDSHRQVARRASEEILHFLDQPVVSMRVLARSMNVVRDSWRRQSLLSQVGLESNAVAELCLIDTAGVIQATSVLDVNSPIQRGSSLPDGYVPDSQKLWDEVRQEGLYVSDIIEYEGQPGLFIGLAVIEGDQTVGVLVARFTLYNIWQQVDQIRMGETGGGILLDAEGRYIAVHSRQAAYLGTEHPEFATMRQSVNGILQWRDGQGREWVSGYSRIADWGWTVVLQQEAEEAFGLMATMQRHANWVIGFSVTGAVLLGLVLLQSITRPVNRLMRTVRSVQAGEPFELQLPVIRDELWELGQAFTEMNQALEVRKAELQASLNFSDRLIEDNPLAIAVVDREWQIVRSNKAWSKLLNGANCWDRTAEGEQLVKWLQYNPDSPGGDNLQIKTEEGGILFWSLRVVPLEGGTVGDILLVVDDQTDRRLLELHYVQAEKLSSLGEMAAGVAHEIKNPLAIIKNAGDLLAVLGPEEVEERDQALVPLRMAVERINERVSNLLDFARPAQQVQERLNIAAILQQLVDLEFKHAEHLGIAIEARISDTPSVLVNRDMVKDIFLNLISNAFDAMPDGGTLTISAEQEGDFVVVGFADTGFGILQKNIQHIFEPFFSTKPPGQGTGLGLAIVHRQIQEIGGRIEVDSAPDQGTRFSIYFPIGQTRKGG